MTDRARELYIDLLARMLTRYGFSDGVLTEARFSRVPFLRPVQAQFRKKGLVVARQEPYDSNQREYGLDWPEHAETMVGLRRLDNLHQCIKTIVAESVPGDLVETGVWRGGASIFMKGVLAAYGAERDLWLCDSFEGLPSPDTSNFPQDNGIRLDKEAWYLAVSEADVARNFERYGLLDEHVHFVKGWFRDTLSSLTVDEISLLRLDGDLYESTIQALNPLYPRISVGGFCVVDDYGNIEACRQAVHDYRDKHGITDEIVDVDGSGVFWRVTERIDRHN
ncbi:macrocin O-methyltransferase [Skermania sp. ID1734]|uniref:TylF/MycF/NovP-related O-methyltransferase n=1 Tax=Skermania sp. ID1734 TaxID=2597516 RepID=UPI001181296A|nr:TylF/MycF/NovP-related O-methyltransferase [Skermania sp. ID1734]TSD94458.1 macrocin O-methyltransferase [Skermania sp. ID1734]